MDQFFMKMFVALQTVLPGMRREGNASERGATAVEYSLLVALIAAVIVGIVATLGGQVNELFANFVALMP